MVSKITLVFMLIGLVSIQGFSQELSREEIQIQEVMINTFRSHLNEEFKDPEESPLVPDSIENFEGLSFYPFNEEYIFKARFERIEDGESFEMKTTTDRLPIYVDFAELIFEFQGEEHRLHVYQSAKLKDKAGYEDYLFLPFNDHTNGGESYGGGRYIDMKIPEGDEIILDFNKSYNPYCSYNKKYSCPIPPEANKLPFAVEAGIKKYH